MQGRKPAAERRPEEGCSDQASPSPGQPDETATPVADPSADPMEQHVSQASGRVLRNAFFLISQPLLLNLISVAVTGYIARALGTEDFGRLNYALAMSALFASLAGLGIGSVTVRDLVQGKEIAPERYLGRTLVLRFAAGIFAYLALVLAVQVGGLLPEAPWAVLVAGTTLFPTLVTVSIEDLFRAREQMHHIARVRLISGVVLTCSSVVALLLGGRLTAMIAVYSAAPFLTLLLALHTLLRRFFVPVPGFSASFTRRVVRQGTIFFAGGLLGSLSQRADKLILERLRGTPAVGEFCAGNLLVEKLAIIPEGLGGATYPALAGLVRLERGEAREALARFLSLAALVGFPVAVGGMLVAEPLIRLIFGETYREAVSVFAVSVWVLPAWCFGQVLAYAIAAVHQERKGLAIAAVGTALLIGGNLLLVPKLGPLGSAAVLTGSQWVNTLLYLLLAARAFGRILRLRPLLHIGAALLVMSGGVLLTRNLPLPVPMLLGAALYGAVIWPQARELIRLVRPARSPAAPVRPAQP